ncbi:MAG: ABC transporter substrate-binding protein [Cyanobacteriota bacterium]|nr:ABC transporter substrate-binding protein [Cyanobacteriota bacterium]
MWPESLLNAALPALLSASLLLLASGCGLIAAPASRPDRLIIASSSRLDSVDPAGAYTFGAMQLLSALGDTLYSIDRAGRLQPRLAADFPSLSPDGLKARLSLRRDVLFHDGTAFDARAMVFTLERFLAIGKLSYLLGERVSGVRAIGSHELEITLKRPYGALPQLLSAVNLTPVSPTAYRNHARRLLNDRFVGTGPYRLVSFSDRKQRLDPFLEFWGPPPANRGLDLVALSNSTALFGALRSGEVDVLLSTGLEIDQQAALHRQASRGRLWEGMGPPLEIGFLSLLTDRAPLNNPVLRQAVSVSLDRELISRRVSLGLRNPLRNLVPPSLEGTLPDAWPGYRPALARKLYRRAGYCDGKVLPLPLTFRSNIPTDRLFALTWQAQLRRDLGDCVKLEVSGMESTTAYRQLGDGAFPMILLDWMGDFPDADNYLVPLLGCDEQRGDRCLRGASAASGSFWAAPGLQEQLRRSAALPGEARVPLLRTIQRRAAAASPYLPVWLVAPRAWARLPVSQPQYDGSGRVLLQDLHRR